MILNTSLWRSRNGMRVEKLLPATWLLTAAALLTASGCSTWKSNTSSEEFSPWSPSTWFKQEYQEPASLAAIWSPDTLATAGQPTKRGFGGRICFYNERSQAVPVEGDLVVHGYLTTPGHIKTGSVDSDQRYVFSSDQLTTHFSPSQIGASYSIWVPWDEAGGFREEITLIATFKSKKGTVVQGTPAKLFLPGKSRIEDALPAPHTQTVSYVREQIPTHPGDGQATADLPTRTTTIEIPDSAAIVRAPRRGFELTPAKAPAAMPAGLPSVGADAAQRFQSLAPPSGR